MPTTHHCMVCGKNGFCKKHQIQCHIHKKSSTTSQKALENLKIAASALVPKLRAFGQSAQVGWTTSLNEDSLGEATLIAVGGYKAVWLIKTDGLVQESDGTALEEFIIRLPCDDALLPNQVLNEVALQELVSVKLPHIPVPRVYYYQATSQPDTSFIVEEFMQGAPLSFSWMALSDLQKYHLARQLAAVLVDLGEVQFDMIGGFNPSDLSSAPTVEGCKLFKGRGKFHQEQYYPIGPYKSIKEYMLACYDREIYYYAHGSKEDIDMELFEDVSVDEFLEELREKRQDIAAKDVPDEPFTLVHGDFQGRNIMVQGDRITAILDWEFAGSYPLSETLEVGGIDVVEADTEELDEENIQWDNRIRHYVREEVVRRGWEQRNIDLLMGGGDQELGRARTEMFPL